MDAESVVNTPEWKSVLGETSKQESWKRCASRHIKLADFVGKLDFANGSSGNTGAPRRSASTSLGGEDYNEVVAANFHPFHCAASQGVIPAGQHILNRTRGDNDGFNDGFNDGCSRNVNESGIFPVSKFLKYAQTSQRLRSTHDATVLSEGLDASLGHPALFFDDEGGVSCIWMSLTNDFPGIFSFASMSSLLRAGHCHLDLVLAVLIADRALLLQASLTVNTGAHQPVSHAFLPRSTPVRMHRYISACWTNRFSVNNQLKIGAVR